MFYANVSHIVGIKEDYYYLQKLRTYLIGELYAFQCTGLDYARPLFIRNKTDTTLKVYILHLELIPDMRPLAFIRAFERFTARRGTPDVITLRLLNHRLSRNLCCFFEFDRHSYYLPWWGVFYERLMRSVKM